VSSRRTDFQCGLPKSAPLANTAKGRTAHQLAISPWYEELACKYFGCFMAGGRPGRGLWGEFLDRSQNGWIVCERPPVRTLRLPERPPPADTYRQALGRVSESGTRVAVRPAHVHDDCHALCLGKVTQVSIPCLQNLTLGSPRPGRAGGRRIISAPFSTSPAVPFPGRSGYSKSLKPFSYIKIRAVPLHAVLTAG
jgi:hypothetical protein